MPRRTPANFAEVVQNRAADGDRIAYSFMGNVKYGTIDDLLSFRRLDRCARATAAWLAERGIATGDRVLLLFPAGLDFIKAFMGCVYAGAVAVPAPPPDRFRTAIDRTAGILHDAEVSAVLTDHDNLSFVTEWMSEQGHSGVPCGAVDDTMGDSDSWRGVSLTRDDLVFLQYTSGSTSEPKGVTVSHGNLLENLESIRRCYRYDSGFRGVGWLPMTHDMGLIGQVLMTSYVGCWALLMPPTEFLRRPLRWLELIDQFNANITVAPNFAYELCVKRVTDEQAAGLDLSRWEAAVNGAEPIQAATLAAFAERFAPAGFRASTFMPSYGLAEATLLVAGTPKGRGPVVARVDAGVLAKGRLTDPADGASQRELVSSGPVAAYDVLIVDPSTTRPMSDDEVGEIWVRGGSVSRGYWRRADLTTETFGAATSTGETGFLRTGDLGAMRGGELYVTGRLKDMMVVRGRNLYPQDLETAARTADEFNCGASAVFALFDPARNTLENTSENIVVVQEIKAGALRVGAVQEMTVKITTTLVQEFGIRPPSVVLVRPGIVRKTTSGKVRRAAMRQLFLDAELDAFHEELTDEARALRAPAKQVDEPDNEPLERS